MWSSLPRVLAAQPLLEAAGAHTKGWAAIMCRLLSGNPSSPADEFNRELADFFGAAASSDAPMHQQAGQQQRQPPLQQQLQQQEAGMPPSPAALLSEVQAANAELLGLMGAAGASQADAPSAVALAQQMAALAQAGAGGASQWEHEAATAAGSGLGGAAGFAASSGSGGGGGGSGSSAGGAGSGGGGEAGPRLTHVDAGGKAAMVDVSHKAPSVRTATAGARVLLGQRVFELVASNQLAKGDVLTVAQLAGVMGAKHTSTLIPLCHPLALSRVHVALSLDAAASAVDVRASATTVGPTGVEMEALTAAAVAALTVYDMCKAASKGVAITDLRLLAKSGGKSGDWARGGGGGGSGGGGGGGGGECA